jgi:flagellar basal body-associated protein FliL
MAEKAKKEQDAPAPEASEKKDKGAREEKKGGGLLSKTPVLLGGVMVIEAAVLFAGFKIFGGSPHPAAAAGAEITSADGKEHEGGEGHGGGAASVDKKKTVEVPVVEMRSPNRQNGHTYFYDVTIVAVTKAEFEAKVKQTVTDRGALIRDRIRTIIAQSDPEKLGGGSEPGLETLRRQVKYQLDEIVGEGMIDEVLVPRCIPFRTDF